MEKDPERRGIGTILLVRVRGEEGEDGGGGGERRGGGGEQGEQWEDLLVTQSEGEKELSQTT